MEILLYITEILGWTALHLLWQILTIYCLIRLAMVFIPEDAFHSKMALFCSGVLLIFISAVATFFYLFEPLYLTGTPIESMPMHYYMQEVSAKVSGQEGILQWLEMHSHWLGMMWLGGSLALFLYWGSGYIYLKKLQKQSTRIEGRWMEKLHSWSRQAGRKGKLVIAHSPKIMSPVLTGIVRPMILIPTGMWHSFNDVQLECILRHEWLHWKRYDHLMNLGLILFESIFFFHPLAWKLGKEVRHLQELIVDRETVLHTRKPLHYAKTLYKVQLLAMNPSLGMTAFAGRKGKLLDRIERILSPTSPSKTKIMNTQNIGIIAAAFLLISLGSLGAYSMKVDISTSSVEAISSNPTPEVVLTDTLPEEEVQVENFRIKLDKNGDVMSVRETSPKEEKVIIIQNPKDTFTRKIRIKRTEEPLKKINYKTSFTTHTNEDGSVDTIQQLKIVKPANKDREKVILIKKKDGKYYRTDFLNGEFNNEGEILSDKIIYSQLNDKDLRLIYHRDSLPSDEEFQQQMQEFSQRMAEWAQRYAQDMQKHMLHQDSFQKIMHRIQRDMPHKQWSEEEMKAFEGRMKAYEERMEAWGEQYGAAMEKWAEKFEKEMERNGKKRGKMDMPPPPTPPAPPVMPMHPELPPPPPPPLPAPDKN